MKKILFLLFVATMINIQGIMAQEKITQTVEADGKAAFQREMIFPIGEPNTAYAKYFIGNSYLAPYRLRQVFHRQQLSGSHIQGTDTVQ